MEPESTRQFATERPMLTNETAERYLPRIRRHAARIARRLPRHVQVGDLVSAGFVGLVDAFMKFDVGRMESFDAYVDHRIRGAILDELRAHDPLTRDQRIFARRLATARQSAANETGGTPDEVEVARVLGITVMQYRAQVERMAATAARSEAAPYDEESVEASDPTHDRPDELAEQHEQRSRIAAAMDRLPARKREVLRMHYDEGRTLREIGEHLGVTESRVSQIHSEAVMRLRTLLCSA
ncbi:MAG: sigma-70 family RNA polymerase sigma factor [Polyangiales bacterium]